MISSTQKKLILDIVSDFNLKMIGIFGSYARGENDQNSDLDILIDFDQTQDLLEIIGLEQELSEKLGIKVDLITVRSLNPQLKKYVEKDLVSLDRMEEDCRVASTGMRDKLIHDYIGVDLWAVWGVIEKIIPKFHEQIQEIIKKEKGGI